MNRSPSAVGAHADARAVEVGEQVLVDDLADGVVVRMAVEQVDRPCQDRQQRVEVVGHHRRG